MRHGLDFRLIDKMIDFDIFEVASERQIFSYFKSDESKIVLHVNLIPPKRVNEFLLKFSKMICMMNFFHFYHLFIQNR